MWQDENIIFNFWKLLEKPSEISSQVIILLNNHPDEVSSKSVIVYWLVNKVIHALRFDIPKQKTLDCLLDWLAPMGDSEATEHNID